MLAKDKPGIYHKSELSQVKDIPERYRNLNLGKDVSAVLGQKKVKPDRKVKQWGLQLLGKDLSQVKDILERYRNLSDREKIKKNTNLSQFYNKKPVDEKRRSLTDAEVRKKFGLKLAKRCRFALRVIFWRLGILGFVSASV